VEGKPGLRAREKELVKVVALTPLMLPTNSLCAITQVVPLWEILGFVTLTPVLYAEAAAVGFWKDLELADLKLGVL